MAANIDHHNRIRLTYHLLKPKDESAVILNGASPLPLQISLKLVSFERRIKWIFG
jgi:hypothetical protein